MKKKILKTIIFQLVGMHRVSRAHESDKCSSGANCLGSNLSQPWYLVTSRDYLSVLHFLDIASIPEAGRLNRCFQPQR